MLGSLRPSKRSRVQVRSTVRMRVSEPSQQNSLVWGQGLLMRHGKVPIMLFMPVWLRCEKQLQCPKNKSTKWIWQAEELKFLLGSQPCTLHSILGQWLTSVSVHHWPDYYPEENCFPSTGLAFMTVRFIYPLFFCMFKYQQLIPWANSISLLIHSAENLL